MLTPNVNSTHDILYFQSTRTLELVLHLESKVIQLKQDALRLMNVALAGTTCGQLLTLFKFTFRYPKSQESKERAKQLEELERHFETEEESLDEGDTVSKAQDQQEAAEQFAATLSELKPKKWKFGKCCDELKDLVPIGYAIPIMLSTTVKLSETGVPHQSYSSHTESEGQSIYRCLLKNPGSDADCMYCTAQMAAMCMHIHRKHLKLCIKCRLCPKKSYSSAQMSLHLKTIHCDQEGEWFKPTLPLEGDLEEVKTEVLAANLQEVKNATAELDDDERLKLFLVIQPIPYPFLFIFFFLNWRDPV